MSRTAEHSIKGFIYQFLVTLSKLLDDGTTELTVEGVIEDVDVVTSTGVEAYQCKYHETRDKFTLSAIYKPVLQMLVHFKTNRSANIKYRLHAHFPNEKVGSTKTLTKDEVKEVMDTTAKGLQTLKSQLSGFTDIDDFLKVFEIQFGHSYDDLESSIVVALSKEGLTTEDVKEIFYPNAVHRIAEVSIETDVNKRKLKKKDFLAELTSKKKTAISRWTKELQSYTSILKKRREQLRDNLNKNLRNRCVVLDEAYIEDFSSKVAGLIEDFVNKYNSKAKNTSPTFSLRCSETVLNSIWKGLESKGITVQRGKVADEFDVDRFLKPPITNIRENRAEFRVRICNHDEDFAAVLKNGNYDDIIVIADSVPVSIDMKANNVEHLETKEINQLKYLLSLNNSL